MNGHEMLKWRPKHKNDVQLFDSRPFLEFGRDMVNSLCDRLGVVLEDIDLASMMFGIDVPLDWKIEAEDLDRQKLRKIEIDRIKLQNKQLEKEKKSPEVKQTLSPVKVPAKILAALEEEKKQRQDDSARLSSHT